VDLWDTLLGVCAGLCLVWLVMVGALLVIARREQDPARLSDLIRLAPDTVRLVRRLAKDPTLPRGVRWRLAALLVYLLSPIDLIPDFVPVIGLVDDAVILTLALRSVVRAAGVEAIERHWPGNAQGLGALKRVTGLHG
jgi:uncharacterized membrane protein YkvA (DUF1232 family)